MATLPTNHSAADRPATDFYPTPPDATLALATWLDARELLPRGAGKLWEPAAGQGHIAEVFRGRGHEVHATDLFDGTYGQGGIDFLTAELPDGIDWIITNPPFIHAIDFASRIRTHSKPGALLLKSQFWHAAVRRSFFIQHPPTAVLPLTWRPDFLMGAKGGSPTMEVAWTIWAPQPANSTHYEPLPRPKG